jgi:hypothetical protein
LRGSEDGRRWGFDTGWYLVRRHDRGKPEIHLAVVTMCWCGSLPPVLLRPRENYPREAMVKFGRNDKIVPSTHIESFMVVIRCTSSIEISSFRFRQEG